MKAKLFFGLGMILILQSCGIFKSTLGKTHKNMLDKNEMIKKMEKVRFNRPYLTQKWKVSYQSSDQSVSFSVKVLLVKDSAIMFSVSKFGFPVGKALVTPDKMAYYENWNKTYFKGSVQAVSARLGLPLRFEQLQALITGDLPLQPNRHKWEIIATDSTGYKFKTGVSYLPEMIVQNSGKIFFEKLVHENREIQVFYRAYEENPILLPKDIFLETVDFKVSIDVKKSDVSRKPDLHFNIPSHYKQVSLP